MSAKSTIQTKTTYFAASRNRSSGWILKTAGALAAGAILCAVTTSWARADAGQPDGPTSIASATCSTMGDDGTCIDGQAYTVVFTAPPQPSGIVLMSPPRTGPVAAQPRAYASTVADTALSPNSTGLAQALTSAVLAALQGSQIATAKPAAPAASVPAAPASSGLSATVRVSGTTVSSLPGAKLGTQVSGTATCPTGKTLLSGGATVITSDGKNDNQAQLSQSVATSATTWTAMGVVSDGNLPSGETLDITAVALCA